MPYVIIIYLLVYIHHSFINSIAWTTPNSFFSYNDAQQYFSDSLFFEEWRPSLWGRNALYTPPHLFLPDLDLGTKLTFFLWILLKSSSAVPPLKFCLIWVDPLNSWYLTLPSYLYLSSDLSTSTLSIWPKVSSFSCSLFHHNPVPTKGLLEWVVHYSQHYKKLFYISPRQALISMIFMW